TYAIGYTTEGAKAKLDATNHIETLKRQDIHIQHELQVEADKKGKAAATSAVIDALSRDPNQPLDDNQLAQGMKYDPEFRMHAAEWQKNMREAGVADDPNAVR